MESLDYEIKFGKHIAFRHKDKQKFTRAKTIGEDYTEEKIKERIDLAIKNKTNYKVLMEDVFVKDSIKIERK